MEREEKVKKLEKHYNYEEIADILDMSYDEVRYISEHYMRIGD